VLIWFDAHAATPRRPSTPTMRRRSVSLAPPSGGVSQVLVLIAYLCLGCHDKLCDVICTDPIWRCMCVSNGHDCVKLSTGVSSAPCVHHDARTACLCLLGPLSGSANASLLVNIKRTRTNRTVANTPSNEYYCLRIINVMYV
jgi:hypothetical protein